MNLIESNSIYQRVVALHKDKNELEILDFLDTVDYDVLDLSNIKILHMIHMYISLKSKIKEFTFGHLFEKLKTANADSKVVFTLLKESIIMYTTNTINDREIEDLKINDDYFSIIISDMKTHKYDNVFTLTKYISEKKILFDKVCTFTTQTDTDLSQIAGFNKILYNSTLKFTENTQTEENKKSESATAPCEIITMINQITNFMNQCKYDEALHSMSQFKKIYGASRSESFFNSFLLKIQFLIKPSLKHAMMYFDEDHEMQTLEFEPHIKECIQFTKLRTLITFSNRLRLKGEYNDYDELNKIITSEKLKLPNIGTLGESKNQRFLNHMLKINSLTIEAQKTKNNDEYYDFLIQMINEKNENITKSGMRDVIICYSKNVEINKEKIIDFYNTFMDYLHFIIKKEPSDEYIIIVCIIIQAYFYAKRLNTIRDIDNVLKSFGLTIDFFISKPDNPQYNIISSIYENIKNSTLALNFTGYVIMDDFDDKSLYTIDVNKNPVCLICSDVIGKQITSVIQCDECKKYIGHLYCFGKHKLIGKKKPCCGSLKINF